jgi:hypothetical protein
MAEPVQPDTFEDGGGDQNTDPEVVTLEESQSVNEYQDEETGYGELEEPPVELDAVDESNDEPELLGGPDEQLTTSEGAGDNDDSGAPNVAKTARTANAVGNSAAGGSGSGKIIPQPNILDRFATYNYQASVYLMSSDQYTAYARTGKRQVSAYNLLFQSGGAPNNVGGPQGGQGSNASGRNPFFPNDFYIDTITLNNSLFGKSSNAAHSVVDMKFTVVEPANITLIDCLYNAVQDMKPRGADGAVNYAAAVYLMVIRFYGQDINGKIQQVGASDPATGLSDANALVEKFIPFRIKEIKFSVGSKLVTYEWDTAPIGQIIANGTRRGTIPADIELTASTVGNMLTGPAQYGTATAPADSPGAGTTTPQTEDEARDQEGSSNPPPPKANSAPNNKKTIKGGLITAMNEFQQQLVKDKVYEKADIYELEFANGAEAIRDGKIAKADKSVNKAATPMSAAKSQDPSQSSPQKNSVDVTARNWGVTAGQQMVQVIDLVIRNSSYISEQALTIIDEKTNKQVPNPKANTKGMKWFNILMTATPLDYDKKRNDYAYRIKYTIAPYTPTDFQSTYFPNGQFRGVHKKYSWWFTGQNTQVLDYTASFNKLYTLTVSGSTPENSALSQQRKLQTSSNRDMPFIQYQARSTESSQGADGKSNELGASAAEYLYNPSDNANAKIRIVGDPAWIQQGALTGSVRSSSVSASPFLPDGTINFDVNDVLFELTWQKPEDYNLNSGVADPYGKTQKTFGDRNPVQNVLYRVKSVVSEFKQGRFEQTLDATLYLQPTPAKSSGSGAGSSAFAATDPRRLDGSGGGDGSDNGDGYGGSGNDASETERTPLGDQTTLTGERASGDQYADGEGGAGYDDYSEAARMEQSGDTGAMVAPGLDQMDTDQGSGEFNDNFEDPASNVSPAESDGGVESNGETVGFGDGDAVPSSGRITEAQRAEINQNRDNGFDVELNPVNTDPQIIARDW